MSILLSLLLGCSGNQTDASTTDCPALTDQTQRDQCFRMQILSMPATDIPNIIKTAKLVSDPMIRGAAVSEWVKNHNNDVSQQQGQQLCSLLDGRDRSYCLRRLSSPHLRR
jgi:hypothetical protein